MKTGSFYCFYSQIFFIVDAFQAEYSAPLDMVGDIVKQLFGFLPSEAGIRD